MSASAPAADTAFRLADRLRGTLPGPWDVHAERARRFEVHLQNGKQELVRGPVQVEGFGLRLIRATSEGGSTGFASSTDLSDASLGRAVEDAESTARHSRFPVGDVELPASLPASTLIPNTVDRALWEDPTRRLEELIAELGTACNTEKGVSPSFGSIRATLTETTLSNSSGLEASCARTQIELEVALKAEGGPQGRPPGEFWANETLCRIEMGWLARMGPRWARMAADVRVAKAPASGPTRALFTPSVLSEILPGALGYRFSSSAQLRQLAIAEGTKVASELLSLDDDGLLPFGIASAPFDGEGVPHRRHALVTEGSASGSVSDLLHAKALGGRSTGNGQRSPVRFSHWLTFTNSVIPRPTTLVVRPGEGGSEEEMAEELGEGIIVEQLGFPNPNEISGSFGGELRLGYRVHHGKRGAPIRGGTVGDNLLASPGERSFLTAIAAIGSRPEISGRLFAPTLRVDDLPVAGG
ncbi:MAG: TldD/PmbA family protein [Candidatus Lutacidiplasmatales archaeon]